MTPAHLLALAELHDAVDVVLVGGPADGEVQRLTARELRTGWRTVVIPQRFSVLDPVGDDDDPLQPRAQHLADYRWHGEVAGDRAVFRYVQPA